MYGAVIGDVVGSRYEFGDMVGIPMKSKDFDFFNEECDFTDDTVMTIAVAEAIIEARDTGKDLDKAFIECMQRYGRAYKDVGYGGTFYEWIDLDNPKPYNSWGNGSAFTS